MITYNRWFPYFHKSKHSINLCIVTLPEQPPNPVWRHSDHQINNSLILYCSGPHCLLVLLDPDGVSAVGSPVVGGCTAVCSKITKGGEELLHLFL